MQPMPGDLGVMMNLMMGHRWIPFDGVFELVSGVLLLAGRFVPLALTVLAALLINILLFNVTLAPSVVGIVATLVLGALEIFLVWAYRESFAGVLSAKAQPSVSGRAY
jgi:putative oxidoreductase